MTWVDPRISLDNKKEMCNVRKKFKRHKVLTDDMFEFVDVDDRVSEKIAAPEYSYWVQF